LFTVTFDFPLPGTSGDIVTVTHISEPEELDRNRVQFLLVPSFFLEITWLRNRAFSIYWEKYVAFLEI
jgi:hypothetical protein